MNGKPPLPPRRHVSQSVTLAELLDGKRPERESFPDEEPTRPRGIEAEIVELGGYYSKMAREDRAYLLRLAEGYAARNAK